MLDLEQQFADADAHGIDVLISSPNHLGEVLDLEAAVATDFLELLNAEVASTAREHPGRFIGLAMLPLQDGEAALQVLESAFAQGLRGVLVPASIAGRPIASDDTLPIYKRMEELGLPLFLHPCVLSNTFGTTGSWPSEGGLSWMYHTALAAVKLIEYGVLDACPNLVVVHPHLGGVLPYVFGRLDLFPRETAKLSFREYLRSRFYVDTVSPTPGALQLAIETYGLEHVLFASDYPFIPAGAAQEWLTSNATPEQLTAIYANRVPGLLPE